MNPEQTERLVRAFESLAIAIQSIALTQQNCYALAKEQFSRNFPERREGKEPTITRVKSDEDLLKEEQGSTDEPFGEWIGFREQAFLQESKASPQGNAKAGGAQASRAERIAGSGIATDNTDPQAG